MKLRCERCKKKLIEGVDDIHSPVFGWYVALCSECGREVMKPTKDNKWYQFFQRVHYFTSYWKIPFVWSMVLFVYDKNEK